MQKRRKIPKVLKSKGWRFFLFLLLLCGFYFSACKDNSACDPTEQPQLQIKFSTRQKYKRPYVDSFANVVVYKAYGLKALKDSTIKQDSLQDTTGIPGFAAPVSNLDSVTTYVIVINQNRGGIGTHLYYDTLKISYSKRLKFISQGCGYSYVYNINNVVLNNNGLSKNHFFQDKQVIQPLISNASENIRLLFGF